MDRDDGLGPRRERPVDLGSPEVERARVALAGDWRRPDVAHGQPGRDVGVGRDDDLVAGADVQGAQGQRQRIQPVGDTDAFALDDFIYEREPTDNIFEIVENFVAKGLGGGGESA